MYVEGKNYWKASAKKDGKCREVEVTEIENGFLVKVNEYSESTSDKPMSNESRTEKIMYSKTNPLEKSKPEEKSDVVDVAPMFATMAKQMGTFLVK